MFSEPAPQEPSPTIVHYAAVSAHILSTVTTPTTDATLDRMHHQGDTEERAML